MGVEVKKNINEGRKEIARELDQLELQREALVCVYMCVGVCRVGVHVGVCWGVCVGGCVGCEEHQ